MQLKVKAKLDAGFCPLSLVCKDMREKTKADGQDIVIVVERNKGYTYTYKTRIFKDNTGHEEEKHKEKVEKEEKATSIEANAEKES